MACGKCKPKCDNTPNEPEIPCSCKSALQPCTGCKTTVNTDCIVYNGAPLSFENSAQAGDIRYLTTLIQALDSLSLSTASEIVVFNETSTLVPIFTEYKITEADLSKLLILKSVNQTTPSVYSIILPGTTGGVNPTPFINKTLKFKLMDITSGTINFNIPITYQYVPSSLISQSLTFLADSTGNPTVLEISYVKVDANSYGWIIV